MKRLFSIIVLIFVLTLSVYGQSNTDKDFTLHLFLLDDCKICWNYFPMLNELYSEYEEIVEFQGYFPNFASKVENIEQLKVDYNIKFPLKTDYYKNACNKFGATVTPEVFLEDNLTGEILYQGRIDNNFYRVGRRRQVVTSHELADALKAVEQGGEIEVEKTDAVGCFINYSDKMSRVTSKN